MPKPAIYYKIETPDEIHTNFMVWMAKIQEELRTALHAREQRGDTDKSTRHRSAYSLAGDGFQNAITQINAQATSPALRGHEGLRLNMMNTLSANLHRYQLVFGIFAWNVESSGVMQQKAVLIPHDAILLPMAQCWRLLYILQPANPNPLLTPPPEPPRPPRA